MGLRRWLAWVWQHLPFVRRRGGPELAGVREPRRPRPPFRPPQAMAAEPEVSAVATLTRSRHRRWYQWRYPWRRRPHAGPAWRFGAW